MHPLVLNFCFCAHCFQSNKSSYMYPKCSKLYINEVAEEQIKIIYAFHPDFERLPREAVFETDKIKRCFFHLSHPHL